MQDDTLFMDDEFGREEDVYTASKYIQIKVVIKDYDARRVMSLIRYGLKKYIKEKHQYVTVAKRVLNKIMKSLDKETPENVLLALSKTKKIKAFLIRSLLNKWDLKKLPLKVKTLNARREKQKENALHLEIVVAVLSFSELMNILNEIIIKKAPRKYKDIVQNCLAVTNIEIEEEEKADFVYKMIESVTFKSILEKVQEDILKVIEELVKDFSKLEIVLQSIEIAVV